MKNWKTTSTGLLMIVGRFTTLYFQRASLTPEIILAAATGIVGGVGLILARDHDNSDDGAAVAISRRPPMQSPATTPPPAPPTSSLLVMSVLGGAALLLSTGCARFTTTQTDLSYDKGQPQREITTRAKAVTFWDSASALANFKASQTDKTQTAIVGSLNQQSTSTNLAGNARALVELLNALKSP